MSVGPRQRGERGEELLVGLRPMHRDAGGHGGQDPVGGVGHREEQVPDGIRAIEIGGEDEPAYVVESSSSHQQAAHKESALTKKG